MNIGNCYDEEIKGEFFFSPLFEMLASMHVIAKPEHHLDRMKWMEKIKADMRVQLVEEIKKYSTLTKEWLIMVDFSIPGYYSEFSIPDALFELSKLSLTKWNKVFKSYNMNIQRNDKNEIIKIMKEYYEAVFKNEINFLQPLLTRSLMKEMNACKEDGLLHRIDKFHERIEIKGTQIILHKNKDYLFDVRKLNKIVITASTFISPHLLMGDANGCLYLTKLVEVEERKEMVPTDLVDLLKSLGDETRLKILHEIRKSPVSTQSLAIKLNLSEAGISKHLKVLFHAGLVEKTRQGNYILYAIRKDGIDFIPYKLYEYIMR
jgi:DNA-binding transcriptional ArsR family regulator